MLDQIVGYAYAALLFALAGATVYAALRLGIVERLASLPGEDQFRWSWRLMMASTVAWAAAIAGGSYWASNGDWGKAILIPAVLAGSIMVLGLVMVGEAKAFAGLAAWIRRRGGMSPAAALAIFGVVFVLMGALIVSTALRAAHALPVLATFFVPVLGFALYIWIYLRRRSRR